MLRIGTELARLCLSVVKNFTEYCEWYYAEGASVFVYFLQLGL